MSLKTHPLRLVKHIHHLLGTVACRPLWSAQTQVEMDVSGQNVFMLGSEGWQPQERIRTYSGSTG
jgi:hypothetical protein